MQHAFLYLIINLFQLLFGFYYLPATLSEYLLPFHIVGFPAFYYFPQSTIDNSDI